MDARLRELVADDFVDHEPDPVSTEPGLEGAMAWFGAMWEAFPDLHMDVRDVIAEDDRVVTRIRVTGTHQGELMGVPPTGRRVDVDTIDIMRVRDGRAVEHWGG